MGTEKAWTTFYIQYIQTVVEQTIGKECNLICLKTFPRGRSSLEDKTDGINTYSKNVLNARAKDNL